MNELFANIRQNGISTWFCSFSCAELSPCPEIVETITRHQGKDVRFEDVSYQERCNAISQNPVIAVTMLCNHVKEFIAKCVYGSAQPIGEVIEHFYRIEFQQRGSLHIHCVFLVKNAPKLDKHADDAVKEFVGRYVWRHVRDEPSLKKKVLAVQTRNPKHSKSCGKGKKVCQFGFPKALSDNVFIIRSLLQMEVMMEMMITI